MWLMLMETPMFGMAHLGLMLVHFKGLRVIKAMLVKLVLLVRKVFRVSKAKLVLLALQAHKGLKASLDLKGLLVLLVLVAEQAHCSAQRCGTEQMTLQQYRLFGSAPLVKFTQAFLGLAVGQVW
jgi:hypothetical protein